MYVCIFIYFCTCFYLFKYKYNLHIYKHINYLYIHIYKYSCVYIITYINMYVYEHIHIIPYVSSHHHMSPLQINPFPPSFQTLSMCVCVRIQVTYFAYVHVCDSSIHFWVYGHFYATALYTPPVSSSP